MSFRLKSQIPRAVDALGKDLLRDEGPQISTVRNYNFAILPYPPEDEFALRAAVHDLSGQLREAGWYPETIALHSLLIARLKAQGNDFIDATIRREKSLLASSDRTRAIRMLKERIVTLIEGPEGLAADVVKEIDRIVEASPNPQRTVIFIGRAGALYPFFRTSALLKHVDGRTRNVPVVLLYPGRLLEDNGLSFMGVLPQDRDYRPRIYR